MSAWEPSEAAAEELSVEIEPHGHFRSASSPSEEARPPPWPPRRIDSPVRAGPGFRPRKRARHALRRPAMLRPLRSAPARVLRPRGGRCPPPLPRRRGGPPHAREARSASRPRSDRALDEPVLDLAAAASVDCPPQACGRCSEVELHGLLTDPELSSVAWFVRPRATAFRIAVSRLVSCRRSRKLPIGVLLHSSAQTVPRSPAERGRRDRARRRSSGRTPSPRASAAWTRSGSPEAERITTFTSGYRLRIWSRHASPSSCGMLMSRTTRSGPVCPIRGSTFAPFVASPTTSMSCSSSSGTPRRCERADGRPRSNLRLHAASSDQ